MKTIKKYLKHLPDSFSNSLSRIYYRWQIKNGKFQSPEKEYKLLSNLISAGDRVVDVGANIGHYTLLFSRLVGKEGRVVAFEPVPKTFSFLASNVSYTGATNVTLINGAVFTSTSEKYFIIPKNNLYQSCISDAGDFRSMAFLLANFIPSEWKLAFLKIDAEGCDENIIVSEFETINYHRPIVMAEMSVKQGEDLLRGLSNYFVKRLEGSHNIFLIPNEKESLAQRNFQ